MRGPVSGQSGWGTAKLTKIRVFMLVLTRKPGESLYIGDEIKITLHGIRGNQVRIGVDAPPHVRIYREEIYLQIQDENRSAAVQSAAVHTDDVKDMAKAWKDRPKSLPKFSVDTAREAGGDEEDE